MTKRKKKKEIKFQDVHLNKEAIKRLVKVTNTPKAWAIYEKLWSLSEQVLSIQEKTGSVDNPPES
jgi:hypothetical protein